MLTREHAIAVCDWQHHSVIPDRLTRRTHAPYRQHAQEMIDVYRHGIGRTRQELHRQVQRIFAAVDDCPLRRIDAFCKLLDEAADFDVDGRQRAAQLRREVFRLATPHHPLVRTVDGLFNSDELAIKTEIAASLKKDWADIESQLFADVIEFHRLRSFREQETPESLLARYNVAQCQAVLYDAQQLTLWASNDLKRIVQAIKLARLMHTIQRLPDGRHRIQLDGPASILRQTQRYGVAMAKFLPSLLTCRDWQVHAKIQARRWSWPLTWRLTSRDGLTCPATEIVEFDSEIERTFAERWGSEPRDGWTLRREDELLYHHQKVFVPDFVAEHSDGRRVYLEIVGFWTPEYLTTKAQTLREFSHLPIALIIAQTAQQALPELPPIPTVIYKTAIKIANVLETLAAIKTI